MIKYLFILFVPLFSYGQWDNHKCYDDVKRLSIDPIVSFEFSERFDNTMIYGINLSKNKRWLTFGTGIQYNKETDDSKWQLVNYTQYTLTRHDILDTSYTDINGGKVVYHHEIFEWDSVNRSRIVVTPMNYYYLRIPLFINVGLIRNKYINIRLFTGADYIFQVASRQDEMPGIEMSKINYVNDIYYLYRDRRTNLQTYAGLKLNYKIYNNLLVGASYRINYMVYKWYSDSNNDIIDNTISLYVKLILF